MSRSKQREQAFILIFESMFGGEPEESLGLYSENMEPVGDFAKSLYNGVVSHSEELDAIIEQFLTGWKLNRISRVNLSILRLAVYEIKYVEDVPVSVAINEAVELAKKYSGQEDASFVNGILGSYARSIA